MLNADGSLLSREIYKYEFDFAGNWSKMTTSVAVIEGGRVTFEPTEVTYRFIMYYLDENMLKAVQPATDSAAPAPTVVRPTVEPKTTAAKRSKKTLAPVIPTASTDPNLGTAGPEAKSFTANQGISVNMEEPPPAPRPILKPISGGVLNGTALTLPPPSYPDAAKRMRLAGVVVVDVVLDETGKVVSASASSGPTLLRDAAVQAALKARFSPTKLSGQPVKVSGTINYKFALIQ